MKHIHYSDCTTMRKSHFLPSLNRSSIAQVFFSICLPLLVLSSSFLRADLNNTVFIVAGGQYSDPRRDRADSDGRNLRSLKRRAGLIWWGPGRRRDSRRSRGRPCGQPSRLRHISPEAGRAGISCRRGHHAGPA